MLMSEEQKEDAIQELLEENKESKEYQGKNQNKWKNMSEEEKEEMIQEMMEKKQADMTEEEK